MGIAQVVMVLAHRNPQQVSINAKAYWLNSRYAFYFLFMFATLKGNSGTNIITFSLINLLIISLAEFFYNRNNKHLFYLLMINRFLVCAVYLDTTLYALFPAIKTEIYYTLLYAFDFDRIFYVVATHIVFFSYVNRNKAPHFAIPVIVSSLVLLFIQYVPDSKSFIYGIVYALGIINVLIFSIWANNIYRYYDNRRLSLIALYFIYSLFITIDHINSYEQMYEILNLNYIYPITLFLATCVVIGNQRFIQTLIKSSFIILMSILSLVIIVINPENSTMITQHLCFIVFVWMMSRIVQDYRLSFIRDIERKSIN